MCVSHAAQDADLKSLPKAAVVGGVCIVWCLFAMASESMAQNSVPSVPDFETHVAPLLIKHCVECHQGKDPSGGLLLTSRPGLLQGGESGDAVDRQKPAASYLLERITSGEMPPEIQGRSLKLPDAEIELIRQWLDGGVMRQP